MHKIIEVKRNADARNNASTQIRLAKNKICHAGQCLRAKVSRACRVSRRVRDGVYLRGDASVPYGVVTQVLAVMRAAGVGDVGLVTDPETRP